MGKLGDILLASAITSFVFAAFAFIIVTVYAIFQAISYSVSAIGPVVFIVGSAFVVSVVFVWTLVYNYLKERK